MASQINPGSMTAISVTLPVLGIFAVATRFYIRISHKQGLGKDDWLILPALFMLIGMGIAIIIGVKQEAIGYAVGTGDPAFINWKLTFQQQIELGVYLMSILNLSFVKLSILYFYRRVFVTGSSRAFDLTTKILVGLISLWMVAFFFYQIFQCGANISDRWGSYAEYQANCPNIETTNFVITSTEFVFDIILFILPIYPIWQLQISTARRLAILVIFALGALAVITSLIKIVIMALIYNFDGASGQNFVGNDEMIVISLWMYWTIFGCGVGVLVACLPTLQVWFRKVTIDAVSKNVRGIFSAVSLSRVSRGSQRSVTHHKGTEKDTDSSRSRTHDEVESVELGILRVDSYHVDSHAKQ